jgi:hypothetical protein
MKRRNELIYNIYPYGISRKDCNVAAPSLFVVVVLHKSAYVKITRLKMANATFNNE